MRLGRALPLLLALALLAAGCGGGGEADEVGSGADIVPASAPVFISVNTDFEGGEWKTIRGLVEKFPDGERAVQMLREEFEEDEGVDWESDVRPALGPELDIVVLDLAGPDGEPVPIALTESDDPAKLEALLAKGDEDAVTEEIDGWNVIAENDAAIERLKADREKGSLADSDTFEEAMADVDEDATFTFYVEGEQVSAALEQTNGGAELPPGLFGTLQERFGRLAWAGGELDAREDGLHFDALQRVEEGGVKTEPYESAFAEQVPADALVFASFNDLEEGLRSARSSLGEALLQFDRELAQVEAALGVSLDEDVLPLLANEGALVVQAGTPIPVVSLMLKVDDEQNALATVDTLVRRAGGFLGRAGEPRETEIDGVPAKELPLGQISLFYAAFDGNLVLTSGRGGIEGLRADGEKLGDDDVYKEAREAVDMPDETTGFVFVNFKEGVPLALDLARLGDEPVPADVEENLRPLESLLFYGEKDGDRTKVSGFLAIE